MSKEQLQQIGKILKMMRIQKELTQLELAKLSKVSPPVITSIERGNANFTIENLIKIANALNCEIKIELTPTIN